jgi:hypothetical protein
VFAAYKNVGLVELSQNQSNVRSFCVLRTHFAIKLTVQYEAKIFVSHCLFSIRI